MGGDLLILGILFVIAYALGRVGKRVGLPTIPIYMLVGLIASPNFHLFPLSFKSADVELVAIFGLLFLLFNLGLEFDQDEFFGNAGALLLSGGTRIVINLGVGLAFGFWVGWGAREALIIAGMTATSSSAIVTKLLIELRRLANRETPVILGITVVEDVFIAFYLAVVAVVIGGEKNIWAIVLQLVISFAFLIAMFVLARWGGRVVARLVGTKDDELFTILFFGLALAFGGIGELLGVSDAIGAFLIGLVLGATRHRGRIEGFALPLRDVFGAFFFLNFGLALDPGTFGPVVYPAAVAVGLTIVVNVLGGQLIALQNKLSRAEGLNAGLMLQNRGEFALILATLASGAGLDARLTPFAGLYVLSMSIIGPVLAVNSERMGSRLFGRRRRRERDAVRDREAAEAIALMAGAADAAESAADSGLDDDVALALRMSSALDREGVVDGDLGPYSEDDDEFLLGKTVQQAMEQSDQQVQRKRDPEY
ncbi:cation:proton antiporter [Galbitalea soli]|nr:cation:proton antiporter [Galbitalea soli]NYJ31838.1 CPA2 family monovalent cation:H+ antiporter-2 [Galbitalea soli]